MRRYLVLVALAGVACGDNSRECGEGTHDEDNDGVCVPDDGPTGDLVCGQGTQLDPVTMDRCVPAPSACGPGLVLVNGVCSDPTAALAVDLEEGPEPNGFEADATPAGTFAIAAGADPIVLHGCVVPGTNADLDVYRVTVAAPTLLDIHADGVQGLVAGFRVTSTEPSAPLATWQRLGLTFGGDVSQREVYLPAAGTYLLALADARTLFPLAEDPAANLETLPAAGSPDGTSCYYVTVTPVDRAPLALDPATGDTSTIDRAVKLFTANGLGAGTYRFTATIGTPLAQPALVVYVDDVLRASEVDGLAQITIQQGNSVRIVGDFVFSYAAAPAPYRLTVSP